MELILPLLLMSFVGGIMQGGNGVYAMAMPFGAGALSKRRALLLYALFIFLGAVVAGGEVTRSLSTDVIGDMDPALGLVSLSSIIICILIANLIKVPLSSSEMTMGAIAGVGLFFGSLFSESLVNFYLSWVLVAVLCFFISYLSTRLLRSRNPKIPLQRLMLIAVGCFFAFSIGANNVGNSVFPLLGIFSMHFILVFGAVSMALGSFVFRGKVMEKVGKDITEIDGATGLVSSLTSALALLILSLLGLPAPAAHFYTLSTMGVGVAKGARTMNMRTVAQIVIVWVISPLLAIGVSYAILSLIN
jgi:sulfate permease